MKKKFFLPLVAICIFAFTGSQCPPSNKCTPPASDSVKPGAGIRIIYRSDADEELWKDFNFREVPGPGSIDILANRKFGVWFTASDSGCLNMARYKIIKKRNGTVLEDQGWKTTSYSSQPVKRFFKGIVYDEPGDSLLSNEYTFYIEARDCHSNLISGQVTVHFKNTLACSNSGTLLKSLVWDGNLITPRWTGTLTVSDTGTYCAGRTIRTIRLHRLVDPDGAFTGSIIMVGWHAKIAGTDHTGFICNETTNMCTKNVSIPLGTHSIEIWSDSHFPEVPGQMGNTITSYKDESIQLVIE